MEDDGRSGFPLLGLTIATQEEEGGLPYISLDITMQEPESGQSDASRTQDGSSSGLSDAPRADEGRTGLSDASRAHGCMRVIRGSHAAGQRAHALRPADPGSMLRRGQRVDGVDDAAAEAMALRAGEMSLHHPWALHCSGPNTTREDRVGVVLVYASPSTAPHNGRGSATLIAGRCDAEHWVLSSRRPAAHGAVADAAALEEHARALALHRGDLQASRPT